MKFWSRVMVARGLVWGIILLALGIWIIMSSFDEPSTVQTVVGEAEGVEVVASGLVVPWEITFLPSNEMLVTERPGRVVRIGTDKTVIEVDGVEHRGEGGLLGLALHPNFEKNNLLYLYFTSTINGAIENRVERYRLDIDNNLLTGKTVILEGIPGASYHDGGRIQFGPDNYLYITTGDAGDPNLAQDTNSLAGKILKVDENGSPAPGNPFGNEVYSYGHRNPQGIAWENDNLWSTEHGRSGIQSGYDELNLITPGTNYGWDIIQGDETNEGMQPPVIHSGSDETWAPAGTAYHDGVIYFTGLRGQTLYAYDIDTNVLTKHFENEYGRLRAVTVHEDYLYFSTSNRDGRGNPGQNDDQVLRIALTNL